MDIATLGKYLEALPNDHKEAILNIINFKTEEEMKEVKQAIEIFGLRFAQAEESTQQQMLQLEKSTQHQVLQLEKSTQQLEKNMERNMKILFWLLGIIGASIVVGVTLFVGYLQFMLSKS